MKKLFPLMMFCFSCNPAPSYDLDKYEPTKYEPTSCDLDKYALIWSINTSDPEWRMEYLDYVSYCIEDSATAIQLAKLDGESRNYTFIIYGFIAAVDPFESIYKKYPIGFHCPGCDVSEFGEIYNRELKKYLKLNEGLDYDSIMNEEFKKNEE